MGQSHRLSLAASETAGKISTLPCGLNAETAQEPSGLPPAVTIHRVVLVAALHRCREVDEFGFSCRTIIKDTGKLRSEDDWLHKEK